MVPKGEFMARVNSITISNAAEAKIVIRTNYTTVLVTCQILAYISLDRKAYTFVAMDDSHDRKNHKSHHVDGGAQGRQH